MSPVIEISYDPARMDYAAIHEMIANSYWAQGMPLELLKKACLHSICFGAFDGAKQVAVARIVTDHVTYAYLCDVMVHADYRGHGVGKKMMAAILAHPDLQELRRFALFTRDAHGLYKQFGFKANHMPENYLEIFNGNKFAPKA